MKKNNSFDTLLFSVGGIIAMLVILLAVNAIVGGLSARVDLTQEKLYTLSQGTRDVLGKLDSKVRIRFYVTQGENEMPVVLKTYAQQIEDLLTEYRQLGRGKITIEKLNPAPDSDAEDTANLDGIEPQQLRGGERIYLGLAISSLDEKVALPFLPPDRDKLLEYDLTRAIARVANPTKPVIGVLSSLPIFGAPSNPMMMQMGQQGSKPWVFLNELKQDFDVQRVEASTESIAPEIKVLLVVHPKNLTDRAQFAIDQFVLRGGKLIALLDPQSLAELQSSQAPPMQRGPQGGSNLDKLLPAWGIQFDPSKIVVDMKYPTPVGGRNGQPENNPTWLMLTKDAIDSKDVVTSQLDSMVLAWSGAFAGTPTEGLKMTTLLKSSTDSQLADAFLAQMGVDAVTRDFKAGGKELPLAIRLTGKFKTAFPNGKPAAAKVDDEEGEKQPDAAAPESNEPGLKEATAEGAVVLVGDSDFIYDALAVMRQRDIFGGEVLTPRGGNLSFVQNMVELLGGDSSLIEMRSRATLSRPFTRIKDMQAKAQTKFQEQIKALEAKRDEARTRISQLQQNKDKSQRFILSPEQQDELKKMQDAEVAAQKELKTARKLLNKEITAMENKLKWTNILAMPALVAISGLVLAFVKRNRTAAK